MLNVLIAAALFSPCASGLCVGPPIPVEPQRLPVEMFPAAIKNARCYLDGVASGAALDTARLSLEAPERTTSPLMMPRRSCLVYRVPELQLQAAAKSEWESKKWRAECLVDPVSNQVICASFVSLTAPAETDEPSGASMRAQMYLVGPETWWGVASNPAVSLAQALGSLSVRGLVDWLAADRIIIHCVDASHGSISRRPIWSIDVRGVANPRQPAGVPRAAVNHLRHLVDATSGRWLVATSTPQPDPKDEAVAAAATIRRLEHAEQQAGPADEKK